MQLPDYPVAQKSNVDVYLYFPTSSSVPGSWFYCEGSPPLNGDFRNAQGAYVNWGMYKSSFTWSAEDSTKPGWDGTTFHDNSVSLPGPTLCQLGDTSSTGWTRTDGVTCSGLRHEFEHAVSQGGESAIEEGFALAAEALGPGGGEGVPKDDVPYTISLMHRPRFQGGDANYAGWDEFMHYVVYNFPGTAGSYGTSLLWHWAHGGDRKLSTLKAQLTDANCPDCVQKPYFTGLNTTGRLALLLHNWRIANFVDNDTVSAVTGSFGFPSTYGYAPWKNLGCWQNVDGATWDDAVAIPPDTVLGSSLRGGWETMSGTRYTKTPNGPVTAPMHLVPFGSEYWTVRAAPELASSKQILVVRAAPDGMYLWRLLGPSACEGTGGRFMLSVVGYEGPDSVVNAGGQLWRHPECAKYVSPASSVDVDSLAAGVEVTLPGFGTTYRAALVVLSLEDGPAGQLLDRGIADTTWVPYKLTLGLADSAYVTPGAPATIAGTYGHWDAAPTWAPSGDTLAFESTIPSNSSHSQIYWRSLSGGSTTPLIYPQQAHNQYTPDWSPRGDYVVYDQDSTTVQNQIWLYKLSSGLPPWKLTTLTGYSECPVFQPNGQGIAYLHCDRDSTRATWQIRWIGADGNGDSLVTYIGTASMPRSIRWAPDGRAIWYSAYGHLCSYSFDSHTVTDHGNMGAAIDGFDLPLGMGGIMVREAGTTQACGVNTYGYQRLAMLDPIRGGWRDLFYHNGESFESPRLSWDNRQVAFSGDLNNVGDMDVFVGDVIEDHAPRFYEPPRDTVVMQLHALAFNTAASDADGDAVTYGATYVPDSASYVNGEFTWSSVGDSIRDYFVVFRAMDEWGGVDNRVVRLSVRRDSVPPDAVNDLTMGAGRYNAAISWTAPGEDGGVGTAAEYDLRISMDPITGSSFYSATRVATSDPNEAGTMECAEASSLNGCHWYYAALKTRDHAGSWSAISNVASAKTRCSGSYVATCDEGMFAQGGRGSAAGWLPENSLFDSESSADWLRLGATVPGSASVRLRLLEQGTDGRLGAVSLVAVPRGAATRAYEVDDRFVTAGTGSDVVVTTAAGDTVHFGAVADSVGIFDGEPGDVLVVDLGADATHPRALVVEAAGRKEGAQDSTGILVQVPVGGDTWNTVARIHPRRVFAGTLVDSLTAATVRLVFLTSHAVRWVGGVTSVADAQPVTLNLLSAVHARLGDVTQALSAGSARGTALLAGDKLTMTFSLPPTSGTYDLFLRASSSGCLADLSRAGRVGGATPLPRAFALCQNRPNPFSLGTDIQFDLPVAAHVKLDVFDVQGRRVRTVVNGDFAAGSHSVRWNRLDASEGAVMPGVYLYRIEAGNFKVQKKMVLLP